MSMITNSGFWGLIIKAELILLANSIAGLESRISVCEKQKESEFGGLLWRLLD